jgi:NADPH-dependent F420 reductase
MTQRPSLAVIGGTGDLGGGLAWRWAKAGYRVIIGSRSAEKAIASAAEITADHPHAEVSGLANADAAAAADLVVLTVPFSVQQSNLEAIAPGCQGKVLLDCTVPLQPPKVARVQLPAPGCAALLAQAAVGEGVDVCSAFHNVGAEHLRSEDAIDCDVLVFGDKVAARQQVVDLVEAAGMKAWHAGPLANSAAAEALTSVLIGINKRYGIVGSGLRITGTPTKTDG